MATDRPQSTRDVESVWNYPRPPRCEACGRHIEVIVADVRIAESRSTQRVLETSHPPVFYIPPEDVRMDCLVPNGRKSWCEWKGTAQYFDVVVSGRKIGDAAWSYPSPAEAFNTLRDHLAFYAHLADACFVDGERVQPQPGGFYGGWITSNIAGPFKGEPGTLGW